MNSVEMVFEWHSIVQKPEKSDSHSDTYPWPNRRFYPLARRLHTWVQACYFSTGKIVAHDETNGFWGLPMISKQVACARSQSYVSCGYLRTVLLQHQAIQYPGCLRLQHHDFSGPLSPNDFVVFGKSWSYIFSICRFALQSQIRVHWPHQLE